MKLCTAEYNVNISTFPVHIDNKIEDVFILIGKLYLKFNSIVDTVTNLCPE